MKLIVAVIAAALAYNVGSEKAKYAETQRNAKANAYNTKLYQELTDEVKKLQKENRRLLMVAKTHRRAAVSLIEGATPEEVIEQAHIDIDFIKLVKQVF